MHFGFDWAILVLGLIAYFLCMHRSRWNFVFGFLTCLCGVIVNYQTQQNGLVVYNVICMGIAMTGFSRWSKTEPRLSLWQTFRHIFEQHQTSKVEVIISASSEALEH